MDNRAELSPLGRNISDAISIIVDQVYDSLNELVDAKCEIPEGFVRIPKMPTGKDAKFQKSKDLNGSVTSTALSAALPAGLAALALAFNAPSAVVVILSGSGGIAGSFIQSTRDPNNVRLNDLSLEELELYKLTHADIRVRTEVLEEKKEEYKQVAHKKVMALCKEISEYQIKMESRHDVSIDKAFGEWVQNFLLFAETRPDDRKLQVLKDELINRLANMRIRVYDDIRLDSSGKPDVPLQDYLIDSREGEEYTKVKKPAVYSDRTVLARGEIC